MWFFIILCFLLLIAYPNPAPYPRQPRYALLWTVSEHQYVLKILPQNYVLLLDAGIYYLYLESGTSSYLPAVRLDTDRQQDIMNYTHILEWVETKYPRILYYTGHSIYDILASLQP